MNMYDKTETIHRVQNCLLLEQIKLDEIAEIQ